MEPRTQRIAAFVERRIDYHLEQAIRRAAQHRQLGLGDIQNKPEKNVYSGLVEHDPHAPVATPDRHPNWDRAF
jgi:hypothetical protein